MDFLNKQLIDSISVGICIIDQNYQVVCWNDYMCGYTGIEREIIIGQQIGDFFPEFNKTLYRQRINPVFEGWPPVFFSSRMHALFRLPSKSKHGEWLYQDITISPLEINSELKYYAVISIDDVTQLNLQLEERNQLYRDAQHNIQVREQIQQQLQVSENKLRETNLAKDRLMSIIAHDLRSPLNAIISYLELLGNPDLNLSEQKKTEIHKILMRGTKETIHLLENLFEWGNAQNEKTGINPVSFELDILIQDVISNINHVASDKQIRLYYEGQAGFLISADKEMIQTVIRNLVSNAIKFTNTGGQVAICYFPVDNNRIEISITDNGVGMSQEAQENIFKLGFNKSRLGTKNEKGTGLGLMICKEFIEKHGGMIKVTSILGQGSTFSFDLPLCQNLC